MSLAALRDAVSLLATRPVLWIPGIAAGLLCALLGVALVLWGDFLAGRLLVPALLAVVYVVAVAYAGIKTGGGTVAVLKEAGTYYFRVLIPAVLIGSGILLTFALVILTLMALGIPPDPGLMVFLTVGVVLPSLMLTFFSDTAAVFENRRAFESLQRSIEVVTANLFSVIAFYIGCFILSCTIAFAFALAWTAALADRLEPLTYYTEAQIASFSFAEFTGLIGQEGLVVTAACIFGAVALLTPVLLAYKACFFRIASRATLPIQQTIGEYDSKGRWYKY